LRTTLFHRLGILKCPLALVKRRFAVRFRARLDSLGIAHTDAFFGTAHAGAVDLRLLRLFLQSGRTYRLVEMALHPAESAPLLPRSSVEEPSCTGCKQAVAHDDAKRNSTGDWLDPLAAARPKELRMLISDELPQLLESQDWRLGRLADVNRDTSS
jgi:hypothetical protein